MFLKGQLQDSCEMVPGFPRTAAEWTHTTALWCKALSGRDWHLHQALFYTSTCAWGIAMGKNSIILMNPWEKVRKQWFQNYGSQTKSKRSRRVSCFDLELPPDLFVMNTTGSAWFCLVAGSWWLLVELLLWELTRLEQALLLRYSVQRLPKWTYFM